MLSSFVLSGGIEMLFEHSISSRSDALVLSAAQALGIACLANVGDNISPAVVCTKLESINVDIPGKYRRNYISAVTAKVPSLLED